MKNFVSPEVNWSELEAFLPMTQSLKNCPQDALYHAEGDVWTHTKMVVSSLVAHNEWQSLGEQDKFITFWAAVLHDIGKPMTTKVEAGRITSKGHSMVGSIDARIWLWKQQVDFEVREKICHIIEHHQMPFFLIDKIDLQYQALKIKALDIWDNLMLFARHDMLGRHYVGQQKCLDDWELLSLWHEENEHRLFFADDHTRLRYLRDSENIDPNYSLHNSQNFTVVMLSGLPGSGKDSVIEEKYSKIAHVSFDQERLRLGIAPGANSGEAVHAAYDKMKKLLAAEKSFVFNATNLSRTFRQKPLDLFYDYGARVEIVYLEKDYNTLIADDKSRTMSVGRKVIEQMLYKWQPPTLLEAQSVEHRIYTSKMDKNWRAKII